MEIRNNTCPICGNTETIGTKTKVSDFVKERIGCGEVELELLRCDKCSFAFYDHMFTPEEEKSLYDQYRGLEYQKQREKHECWYTAKVNNALDSDTKSLEEQRRVIGKLLNDNGYDSFENALDYGGNEGATYIDKWGTANKYVYDISGCDVLPGITSVDSVDKLYDLRVDFVMSNMTFEHLTCVTEIIEKFTKIGDEKTVYYVEVPSEFPFGENKFSIKSNLSLLINPNFNIFKLAKYYMKKRNEPFFPMQEHVNFYTVSSLRMLVENYGFSVIDVQENYEMGALGKSKVLSALFKK